MDKLKNLISKAANYISKAANAIVKFLNPIAEKFNMETDKLAHLVVAFFLTLLSVNIFGYVIGIMFTSVMCVIKEMYDAKKENPTGFSKEDLKYDLYGMLAALVLLVLC